MRELLRALAVLVEPPEPAAEAAAARIAETLELPPPPPSWQYTALFVEQLYPYASVYLGNEGKLGGEARDRVAGFWRALGQSPPAEPDHLAVLLGLLARLEELQEGAEGARAEAWRRTRAVLYSEHLEPWLTPWLARLQEIAPTFYRAWGELLRRALDELTRELPLAAELPVALRDAEPSPVPEELGGDAFLAALLVPVRTGVILVRDDLARAAAELGMALRVGERRWVLAALLQQAPAESLEWLAAEARRQAEVLSSPAAVGVRGFWVERATETARTLARSARQAGAESAPGRARDAPAR